MLDLDRLTGRYKGLTAVVFGGAGALGRCVCRQLYAGGACVIAVDRNLEGLKSVREDLVADLAVFQQACEQGGKFNYIELDMLSDESVGVLRTEIEKHTDSVDMLICAAGGVVGTDNVPVPDLATFRASFEENFLTVPKVIIALLDLLVAGKGAVAITSSVNAITGMGQAAYSVAKVGLHAVARCFAVQFGHRGIRFNVVVLGTAVDPAAPNPRWAKAMEGDPQMLEKIGAWFPRDKSLPSHVPHPEEAASLLCFLASPESSMKNGSVDLADAGWTTSVGTAKNMEEGGPWFNRVARSS